MANFYDFNVMDFDVWYLVRAEVELTHRYEGEIRDDTLVLEGIRVHWYPCKMSREGAEFKAIHDYVEENYDVFQFAIIWVESEPFLASGED